jgi:hypothetical protein
MEREKDWEPLFEAFALVGLSGKQSLTTVTGDPGWQGVDARYMPTVLDVLPKEPERKLKLPPQLAIVGWTDTRQVAACMPWRMGREVALLCMATHDGAWCCCAPACPLQCSLPSGVEIVPAGSDPALLSPKVYSIVLTGGAPSH